jgi:hypothetical protein
MNYARWRFLDLRQVNQQGEVSLGTVWLHRVVRELTESFEVPAPGIAIEAAGSEVQNNVLRRHFVLSLGEIGKVRPRVRITLAEGVHDVSIFIGKGPPIQLPRDGATPQTVLDGLFFACLESVKRKGEVFG